MANAQTQRALERLLARFEPDVRVGVQMTTVAASIAISLKRIADQLEHNNGPGPPSIKRRCITHFVPVRLAISIPALAPSLPEMVGNLAMLVDENQDTNLLQDLESATRSGAALTVVGERARLGCALVSATLTTTAFDCSSVRWLEIST